MKVIWINLLPLKCEGPIDLFYLKSGDQETIIIKINGIQVDNS